MKGDVRVMVEEKRLVQTQQLANLVNLLSL